jgi:hypothetical protein
VRVTRHTADDIATGATGPGKLRIAGRPGPGRQETYVLLEEPGPPVLMHWAAGRKVPHFRRDCPHCAQGAEEPKPLWYLGAFCMASRQQVLLELTEACFRGAGAAAARLEAGPADVDLFGAPLPGGAVFTGLVVTVSRGGGRSPRVLRCEQRAQVGPAAWPYRTREELARVWGVPVRPRLYKEEGA